MTAPDPALATCVAHERRRRAPLPPLADLTEDEAIAIVRADELARAEAKFNEAYRRAVTP